MRGTKETFSHVARRPGRDAFDQSNVILMERLAIRSDRQVLRFVSDMM